MFIIAKRNYLVRRADGSFYRIEKDYIGEIPEDVAERELAVILRFRAVPKTRSSIRQMMRRQSRQQNMTSVLTLRNLRRRKRLRSL